MKSNPTAGILLILLGALIIAQGPGILAGLFTGGTKKSADDINKIAGTYGGEPEENPRQYSGGPTDPDAYDPNKPKATQANYPGAYVGAKGAAII